MYYRPLLNPTESTRKDRDNTYRLADLHLTSRVTSHENGKMKHHIANISVLRLPVFCDVIFVTFDRNLELDLCHN